MANRVLTVRLPEETYQRILAESREGVSHFVREAIAERFQSRERRAIDEAFASVSDDDYDIEPEFYSASAAAVASEIEKRERAR